MRCTKKKALAEALKRGQSIGPQVVKVLHPEDVFTKSFVIKSQDGIVLLPKSIEFSKGKVMELLSPWDAHRECPLWAHMNWIRYYIKSVFESQPIPFPQADSQLAARAVAVYFLFCLLACLVFLKCIFVCILIDLVFK